MPMKPEVKVAWVKALRSGKYNQTRGRLVRLDNDTMQPVGYCCLGVLCEVLEIPRIGRAFDGMTATLPDSALDRSGLEHYNPRVRGYELSTWNDSSDVPRNFAQIADMIEASDL